MATGMSLQQQYCTLQFLLLPLYFQVVCAFNCYIIAITIGYFAKHYRKWVFVSASTCFVSQ